MRSGAGKSAEQYGIVSALLCRWFRHRWRTQCVGKNYKFFEQQKKAQEARIKQVQRAGVIDQLLTEANEQGQKTEETPVKETAPAK